MTGTGGGLTKATWIAGKALKLKPGEKCRLHPDREATHLIVGADIKPRPACRQCAEYGKANGWVVHEAVA